MFFGLSKVHGGEPLAGDAPDRDDDDSPRLPHVKQALGG
jgi:hypothetical protein